MNHSNKIKNFNRTTAHRKLMFSNMVTSFEKHGHVRTTLPKAKFLKSILEEMKIDNGLRIVRISNRRGDNAAMAEVLGDRRINRLSAPKKKNKKEARVRTKTVKAKKTSSSKSKK